ncbi:MAG: oxidoreductase [Firmicutes bacterium]|nr:oxidoreductase [Bacillota bacterium]
MVRFGVVGTNWITEEFISAAKQVDGFCLAAVYSRSREKAQAFAARHQVNLVFTDIKEMAQDQRLDAVYIASPNSLHAEQTILFLSNKKHVLCEKPLASNTKEVKAMFEAARDNQVLLMEALKTTFLPNFLAIQRNLPKIGRVRRYFANYCQYSSRYDLYKEGKQPNTFNPAFSGGALMDLGVYCLYPAVALFGRPQKVQATAFLLDSGVDGAGSLTLSYPDGDAVLMYSKITNSSVASEIQGEKGNIVIDKIAAPIKSVIEYRDGSTEDITVPQSENSMYYEAKEFINLIQDNKLESAVNSFKTSLTVMEIMETARQQFGLIFPADSK